MTAPQPATMAADVIVVGAGIVGVATALHLQQRGKRVLLIDRGAPGQETSYGNSGIIEASHVLPFSLPPLRRLVKALFGQEPAVRFRYVDVLQYFSWAIDFYFQSQPEPRQLHGRQLRPLVATAIEEHRALMRGTDAEKHLSPHGRVKLHRSAESFAGSSLERKVADATGVPYEVFSAQDFLSVEPDLRPAYHTAVRWLSSARLTNPGAVVTAYAERFVREGGQFLRADVSAIAQLPAGQWRVRVGEDDYEAPHVVLCAGPWSGHLTAALGFHFPLGIKRGYHRHFAAQDGASLKHALVDADIGYLICPMEQGYRITTGAELAALTAPPNPVQLAQVLPYARQLFPLGEPVEETTWLGSRPCFADSLPVIGPAGPAASGLWFNFGHGHSGLTIGPGSGRLLAEMLCGMPTFCDPAPYRLSRFA